MSGPASMSRLPYVAHSRSSTFLEWMPVVEAGGPSDCRSCEVTRVFIGGRLDLTVHHCTSREESVTAIGNGKCAGFPSPSAIRIVSPSFSICLANSRLLAETRFDRLRFRGLATTRRNRIGSLTQFEARLLVWRVLFRLGSRRTLGPLTRLATWRFVSSRASPPVHSGFVPMSPPSRPPWRRAA